MIQLLANQNPKNVDEHLYHTVLTWFFVPLLLFMAVAPFASWAKASWKTLLNRSLNSLILSFGLLGLLLIVFSNPSIGVHADAKNIVTGLFGLSVKVFSVGHVSDLALFACSRSQHLAAVRIDARVPNDSRCDGFAPRGSRSHGRLNPIARIRKERIDQHERGYWRPCAWIQHLVCRHSGP